MAEQKLQKELVKASKATYGFQCKAKQLEEDKKKLQGEIKVLRDQLAICKQDLRVLGKRPARVEPEEAVAI